MSIKRQISEETKKIIKFLSNKKNEDLITLYLLELQKVGN